MRLRRVPQPPLFILAKRGNSQTSTSGSSVPWSLRLPRVYNRRRDILKVLRVPRRKLGMRGDYDAGDHGGTRIAGTFLQLQRGCEIGCLQSSRLIEIGDSILDNLG